MKLCTDKSALLRLPTRALAQKRTSFGYSQGTPTYIAVQSVSRVAKKIDAVVSPAFFRSSSKYLPILPFQFISKFPISY